MLTDNFNKMIFILGGTQTGINTAGSSAQMFSISSEVGQYGTTLGYSPSESTWTFTEQLTAPDVRTNTKSVDSRTVYNAFYNSSQYTSYRNNTLALLVGSGTTPPTKQDYKLENQIVLQSDRDFCNWTPSDSKITLCRQFVNNTESPVNIQELGVYLISSSSYNTVNIFLVGRLVLSQPVNLPVGGSHVFTYSIDMNNIITEG